MKKLWQTEATEAIVESVILIMPMTGSIQLQCTVNGRLKFWNCLKQVFRHPRDKHHLVFRAVLVIEQIKIQNGQPPFQVTEYLDPIFAWE